MTSLDLKDIFRRLVIAHGLSGSGKGEAIAALRALAEEEGIRVLTLGSGDVFRTIRDKIVSIPEEDRTPEQRELGEILRSGKFVPTLHLARPDLVENINEFITDLANGKETILVLDGFLRRGDFEWEEEGRMVPSQIAQLAAAFNEAMGGQYINFWDANDPLLDQIEEEIVNTANHLIINIPNIDAEALMRFRAVKELRKIAGDITRGLDSKAPSDELVFVIRALTTTAEILAGRFQVDENGELRLLGTNEAGLYASELMSVTREHGLITDRFIEAVCQEAKDRFGLEKALFSKIVEKAISLARSELGLEVSGSVRDDDILFKTREKRIREFHELTVGPVLIEGLNIDLIDLPDGSLEISNKENLTELKNGPSKDITYPILKEGARVVAGKILVRSRGERVVEGEREKG